MKNEFGDCNEDMRRCLVTVLCQLFLRRDHHDVGRISDSESQVFHPDKICSTLPGFESTTT